MQASKKISVVVPVYNSATTLPSLIAALDQELRPQQHLELILVNDGSSLDDSDYICEAATRKHNWIVYLELSKNFGEHNAVMAGLNHVSGEFVVVMDDDLQNPPHEVIRLVDALDSTGSDVVYSYYTKKQHNLGRNLGSAFHNVIASYVFNKPRDLYLSSFKAMRRSLVDQIIKYDGPFPYIDGLILRTTRHWARLEVKHYKRAFGKSNYSFGSLLALWLNMFTNFSILPLRMATFTGLALSTLSGVAAVFIIIERLVSPDLPSGWASVIVVILFISSVQLFALGLIGEYLGRVLLKINHIPQYVVRRKIASED
jgi:glycosyltransferase involved in cell wall biosynthesis